LKFVNKLLDILPVPFWIYFLSIVAGTVGVLPHQSAAYDWTTRHVLPAAIILMLIGTPLKDVEELLIRKTLEATSGDKNLTAAPSLSIGPWSLDTRSAHPSVPDEGWILHP
jgi:hypothetical protein